MNCLSAKIAGLGWVTPLGGELDEVWRRVQERHVVEPRHQRHPETGQEYRYLPVPQKAVEHVGRNPRLRRSSAISYYAVAAGLAAIKEAIGEMTPEIAARTALVFAVSDGGVLYTRKFYEQIAKQGANCASPLLFPETVYNAPASHLAALLGVDGASYTLVGDNSVGLAALHFASQLLVLGAVDHCVVVGAEECDWILCEAYHTWRLARLPLSEGAAAVVLARDGALDIHTTAGSPFARRCEAPAALETSICAGLGDSDIDFVAASANGTFIDGIEARAIEQQCPNANVLKIKDVLGEAPGASALWQVIAAAMAVRQGSARTALVPVLGFNQQAAAARVSAAE